MRLLDRYLSSQVRLDPAGSPVLQLDLDLSEREERGVLVGTMLWVSECVVLVYVSQIYALNSLYLLYFCAYFTLLLPLDGVQTGGETSGLSV